MTEFFAVFAGHGPEKATAIEIQQGKNLANASAATSTPKHYIWSTLPDSSKILNSKYTIPRFERKRKTDEYIRTLPTLLSKTTFLWVTFYAQNYQSPVYTTIYVKTAGKYIQLAATGPGALISSIGDVAKNIGIFTSDILAQPELTLDRYVLASVVEITAGSMLETWSRAMGKSSAFVKTILDDLFALWPNWGLEIGLMMQFWEEAWKKSWDGEEVLRKEDLGIQGGKFVGIEEIFNFMDWDSLL